MKNIKEEEFEVEIEKLLERIEKVEHNNKITVELIDWCLTQLKKDKEHDLSDEISENLTYIELISALLSSKKELYKIYDSLFNIIDERFDGLRAVEFKYRIDECRGY